MRAAIDTVRPNATEQRRTISDKADEELLLDYKATGNRLAFEELVHRYEREMYSYLRRYVGDATLAEDAFQGTFLQVHLKLDHFDPQRKFRPWLYTIATNQAIDVQRRNKRHRMMSLDRQHQTELGDISSLMQMLVGNEPSAASKMEREERQAWVRRAIEQLPEQLRSALILVYYQGIKYREAADVLGIPVGTVKSRLHTALLKLNEMWHESHPSEHE
jgi:RNA polymerase sigma-70 factor, ECF subfamily